MKDDKFSRYKVLYRKPGGIDVSMSISTGSIEQVYDSICRCANVKSTMDLEFLEVHSIKDNGEVHVYKDKGVPKEEKSTALALIPKIKEFLGVTKTKSVSYKVVPVPTQQETA